jgi:hypothetical protein
MLGNTKYGSGNEDVYDLLVSNNWETGTKKIGE